ncbi:tape measure protein [Acinetobacter sp. ANC 5033]|uniref:tape measure protein n=1 Tax=Acinetobacter amyesii TaxID=2942470 RepID=UPI00201B4C53|nr:tape measure protein [Acinetobacter amyesii]MCL6236976.1 tape measure protein [Acinetobacter amyesii]
MSGKNLTFKLILDGDSKGLVAAAKQSEDVTKKVFETIRAEAKNVQVDALISELNKATKEISNLGDKSTVSASQLRDMSMQSQQMIGALNTELVGAQAELVELSQTKATPSDIQNAVNRVADLKASIQSVEAAFGIYEATATDAMVGVDKAASKTISEVQKFTSVDLTNIVSEAQSATRAIDSMGDGAVVSTKEVERIGQLGATAIDALQKELTAANVAWKALADSSDDISLEELTSAKTKVSALEQALELAETSMHEFSQASQQAIPVVDSLDQSIGNANQELNETETASQRVSNEIQGLKTGFTALTGALAALGIGTSAMEIAQTADEYKNLSGRINIAIGEHGNLQKAMDDVKNVAIATNSNLTATGDLYSRLTKIGQEMKWPQEQALALTETINKAIQVGGGSAASNEAAITQLNQALGSGVLRGDEFNSMMEQSPRLSQALADGLGVATGKLREMASEGQLTTDVVTKALLSQSEKISAEYAKFPATIGAAIENLKTAWTIYIGEADAASGASEKVANALKYVAENLDTIVSTLTLAGQAFIAYKALNIASVFLDKAAGVRAASTAIAQETTVVVANTQAQIANAAATRGAATAKTQLATNSAAAGTSMAATGGSVMNLISRLGALGIAITAIGVLIPTVAVPLGTAIGEGLAKSVEKAEMAFSNLGKASEDKRYLTAIQELESATKTEAAQAKVAAEIKAEQAAAAEKARDKTYQLTEESKKLVAEFDELIKKGEPTKEALEKISNAMKFDSTKGINDSVTALIVLQEQGKITSEDLQLRLSQALDGKDLLVFETNAKAAFAGTSKEAEKTATLTEAVMKASLERTGLSTEQLQGKFSLAFQSASNDVQVVLNNLDAYKAKGIDTGLALSANLNKAIDTAQTRAELDYAKSKLIELEKQGLITGEQVALGLTKIEQKAKQLPVALNPVQAAFSALGIQTKEQLNDAATSAQRNFDVVSKSGQATADAIKHAYTQMLNATIATGDKAQIAIAQAKAASLGLEVQIDSSGKASVKSYGELEESIHRVRRASSSAEDGFRNLGQTGRDEADSVKSAWEEAVSAASNTMHETRKGTKGKMAKNAEDIEAELKAMGYSDTAAKQHAKDIYEGTKGVNGYKSSGFGFFGGLSNVEQVNAELERMQQYAPNNVSTKASGLGSSSKTISYELKLGNETVQLTGSAESQSSLEAMLKQLGTLSKST